MASSGKEYSATKLQMNLTSRSLIALLVLLVLVMTATRLAALTPLSERAAWWVVGITGFIAAILLSYWLTRPIRQGLAVLDQALLSFRDGDFSLRLVPPAQRELHEMTVFFNDLVDLAREERNALYQRELLLDTLVQSTPVAMILLAPNGRVELVNREARELFHVRGQVKGVSFKDILTGTPDPFREALAQERDALFTVTVEDDTETYHLARRQFRINTLLYQIILVKRLTRELRRQEVTSWKKLIRLLNHEMNNTLAPMRSLVHSARKIIEKPDHQDKLVKVFDTLDTTALHLQRFLEDYATFARLPSPRKESVAWDPFLKNLAMLADFTLDNRLIRHEAFFDPGQMQQALLNLFKNAHEASIDGAPVTLYLANTETGGTLIRVLDRGKGMRPEAMEKALLPFFSTKKAGTGLGLPLCREIIESHGGSLKLEERLGGGTVVSCSLPVDL